MTCGAVHTRTGAICGREVGHEQNHLGPAQSLMVQWPYNESDRATCPHADFRANVAVSRLEDAGRFVSDIRVQCAHCGEPFRFLGVPAGVSFEQPRVSIDALELRAPIEPEGTPQLLNLASFQMPNIPGSN